MRESWAHLWVGEGVKSKMLKKVEEIAFGGHSLRRQLSDLIRVMTGYGTALAIRGVSVANENRHINC